MFFRNAVLCVLVLLRDHHCCSFLVFFFLVLFGLLGVPLRLLSNPPCQPMRRVANTCRAGTQLILSNFFVASKRVLGPAPAGALCCSAAEGS